MYRKVILLLVILLNILGCSTLKENKKADYALIRGINLAQREEYEKALEELYTSYKINPKNQILLKELGFIYFKIGNYDKAEEFWKKGLELNDKDEDLIRNLSTLYYLKNDYQNSLKVLENSYNVKGEFYHKMQGMINYKENNYKQAEENFKKVKFNSDDFEIYKIQIECLKKLGKKDEMYKELEKGKEIYKNISSFNIYYARNMIETFKKYDYAEKILLKELVTKSKNDEILKLLIQIYNEKKEFDKARDTYNLLENKENFREFEN